MVDAESLYHVQEQELQRRLPHVPLAVIKHFLAQYQGNLDECYHRLRPQTAQPTSPNMEPFFSQFSHPPAVSTSHLAQYRQRPPQDHRSFRRQLTWASSSHTLPSHSSHSAHQVYGQHTQGGQPHDGHIAPGVGATYGVSQPSHAWTTSFPRETHNSRGVIAVNRVRAQHQQLQALNKYQEHLVQLLSHMKQGVEERKERLSVLRMQVSALITEQHVAELKEVIQTLEIDLREARCELQVHNVQSQMKQDQDLYTDEGVRWYCKECSFLNHPLMTICEKCDIPKVRAH